jgi:membrane protease subunit HflK
MPWNSQGGGWHGGGQGPWGQRPGGGGGGAQPPDLEELLRRSQEKMKQLFPGGGSGGSGGGINKRLVAIVGAAAIAVWALSGFYVVQPDEQGVVLRFGKWTRTTQPGLNYHLPVPIETALTPKVTRVNREEIGFRDAATGTRNGIRDVPNESLILTGDENIVDVNFVALWEINDAGKFLFNVREPAITVKAVAEAVMREVIGKTPFAEATTEGRGRIELEVRTQMQSILDSYGAGVQVNEVQLQKVDPPGEVIDAFRDVQRAQADRERLQNEAEAFANDILPRARGEAERVLQESEGYRQAVVAAAQGDAQRFMSVVAEYQNSQDITVKRIYLESGVIPYLPLPEFERRARQNGSAVGSEETAP